MRLLFILLCIAAAGVTPSSLISEDGSGQDRKLSLSRSSRNAVQGDYNDYGEEDDDYSGDEADEDDDDEYSGDYDDGESGSSSGADSSYDYDYYDESEDYSEEFPGDYDAPEILSQPLALTVKNGDTVALPCSAKVCQFLDGPFCVLYT